MQKSQRKKERFRLCKRQYDITTMHCESCENNGTFSLKKDCADCPFYQELNQIGNELIALSGRDEQVEQKKLNDFRELIAEGLTESEIAEILGYTVNQVHHYRRKHKLLSKELVT